MSNTSIEIKAILRGNDICELIFPDGTTKKLTADMVNDSELSEYLTDDMTDGNTITIFGDYCAVGITAEKGQWGRTIVWDFVQNKVLHLTSTPFIYGVGVAKGNVIGIYDVSYWGHPSDAWYSVCPLDTIDADFEPERIKLDASTKDFSKIVINEEKDKVILELDNNKSFVVIG